MRVEIFKDERYPDYSLTPSDATPYTGGRYIDVTEEFFERYKKACDEYAAVQGILKPLYMR